MVPPGSTSVTICGPDGRTLRTLRSGYRSLVAALNALHASPWDGSCTRAPGRPGPSYRLLFGYPRGPAVRVTVDGRCLPAINNISLEAASARTIVSIIEALLSR